MMNDEPIRAMPTVALHDPFALHYPFSDLDIMNAIRAKEARENAKRRKARKERARELTRINMKKKAR
jgi:hypothetical protein